MTHDIRTPMNAILGMTTLAIQNLDESAESGKEALEMFASAAK